MDFWEPWHYWVIFALVLVGLEALTPSFLFGAIAVAAFAAAAATLLGLSLTGQLLVFAGASLLTVALLRPLVLRYFSRASGEAPEDPMAALLEAEAEVVVALDGERGAGRVKARGTTWNARSYNREPIAAGERVRVLAAEGLTLLVAPIEKENN